MDERLELLLLKKYPKIFRAYKGDPRETCMAWGMTCGDGWYFIIDEACRKVSILTAKTDSQVVAHQVKEKFGGLRFYYGIENYKSPFFTKIDDTIRRRMYKYKIGKYHKYIDKFRKKIYRTLSEKIHDAISEAEIQSYKVCETCGAPGERRGRGWITTCCDKCDSLFEQGYRQYKNPEMFDSLYDLVFGKE